MPKMSNLARFIDKTSSRMWVNENETGDDDDYKSFCLNRCPHAETPCNGTCAEIKEFIKIRRKQWQERKSN